MKKIDVIVRTRTAKPPKIKKIRMCKCGRNPATKRHSCPYQEEINDDYSLSCTCCADCENECAMDI